MLSAVPVARKSDPHETWVMANETSTGGNPIFNEILFTERQ
jgi:hypothetical protein